MFQLSNNAYIVIVILYSILHFNPGPMCKSVLLIKYPDFIPH